MIVLIEEVEHQFTEVVEAMLEHLDYRVKRVRSLAAFQHLAESMPIDGVITGITFSDGTAFDLERLIRAWEPRPSLVVMCNSLRDENEVEAIGAEGLRKPFGITELHDAIRQAVQRKRRAS